MHIQSFAIAIICEQNKMKTENKIIFVFSIIVIALVCSTVFLLQNITRFNEDNKQMVYTREVSKLLSDYLSIMQDVETGERGFVITGMDEYLKPYHAAIARSQKTLEKLRQLTKNYPLQQRRINTLEQASELHINLTQQIINLRRVGLEPAMQLIRSERAKSIMDNIREITFAMQKEVEELIKNRTKTTEGSLINTRIVAAGGGLFSITIVIFLMFFIQRSLKLSEELRRSKERAEELVSFKDQFMASMSHEIRTPLNGIIGFTKILLRNETTEVQKQQLDAIKTSCDTLLVLINDILDLEKIEAGKMNIEITELKLSELINSVLGSFDLRFQEKGLKITLQYDEHIPSILLGDPVRINQILLNLLSNSAKFTSKGGKILIGAKLLRQDDENAFVEFLISDTGIGIPKDKLETIFQPFIQSSSDTARKYGGTGLGLSIVQRLVNLMQGNVSLKSTLHKGTTFSITIPFQKTAATAIPKEIETTIPTEELKRTESLKILLVEDNPINQFLVQTILFDLGFQTDTAENGKIGIELLEQNDYDIILMDLMMPEMDGFEATQHIRNKMKPPKSATPIIALTADVTKADVDKCMNIGMNEYVSKPINEADLLRKIDYLVVKSKKSRSVHPVLSTTKICNLNYLKSHSPNNPKFISEMIQLILKQTPTYLSEMARCIAANDWNGLQGAVHKIRPSIHLIGMPEEITLATKQIEEYYNKQTHLNLIPDLFDSIEKAFTQSFEELKEELKQYPETDIKT